MVETREEELRSRALSEMVNPKGGFDVVIVCTGTAEQAQYWQEKLEKAKGVVIPEESRVICVFEDWNGGAGNGLGTLYAWKKARDVDERLGEELRNGEIAAAIYHTAGKGTRLAPLPGAENNNKPGVKLPATSGESCLTILEAVCKQTGVYAKSRKGRLSVFWGDQIFVPTMDSMYEPTAHADILCTLGPMPSAEEWAEKGLEKYGLVAVAASGAACQIEKVDHATAVAMTSGLGEIVAVGTSLGSFSVTAELLETLTAEFAAELAEKTASLDSDPHWWMPMTLPCDAYCQLMAKKGVSHADSVAHHSRIADVLARFHASSDDAADDADAPPPPPTKKLKNGGPNKKKLHVLGPVDVGANAYWWDYGQLKLYVKNALRLLDPDVEADAMRAFFGVSLVSGTGAASSVETGPDSRIQNSVLADVHVETLVATDAIAVHCTAKSLTLGRNAVAYNVVEDGDLVLADGDVVTDVFMPDGSKIRQASRIDVDGGKQWKIPYANNPFSFEQVYKTNLAVDVLAVSKQADAAHARLKAQLNLS